MDFEIPKIDDLTGDALADAREQAREAAKVLNAIDDKSFSDENLNKLTEVMDFLGQADEKAAEEAAKADRVAELRQRASEVIAEAEATVAEVVEEAPVKEVVEETVTEKAPEAELVPASTRKKERVVTRAAAVAPAQEVIPAPKPSIVAAADVPGFPTGGKLDDLNEVAQGFIERFTAMPRGRSRAGIQQRFGVALINKPRTDGLSVDKFSNLQDALQAAGRESRLPGGSLTAAGGWCAPSETIYDLCTIESTDGLWDLPEVNAPRGGLQFTKGPDFSDFYAYAVTAWQTEAEAEAGTEKVCIPVECPPFEEVRLDAVYACISAGILTNAAYPELIRRYIEGVLIAMQHAISARMIAAAEEITGPAIPVDDVWENATSLLSALELVAEGERERYRMARSATLEVILPYWVRPALRADLSNRTGVDLVNVTNEMLDSFFTNRGIRVQWLYNYQPLDVDTNGVATDYPTTLETIMYPAGTFVKLTNDVIRLDAVYDSVGLSTNTYTAMFAEEGVALANVCNEPRRISIDLCVSGRTGAADISACFGQAAA